jgi:hypothetical protein
MTTAKFAMVWTKLAARAEAAQRAAVVAVEAAATATNADGYARAAVAGVAADVAARELVAAARALWRAAAALGACDQTTPAAALAELVPVASDELGRIRPNLDAGASDPGTAAALDYLREDARTCAALAMDAPAEDVAAGAGECYDESRERQPDRYDIDLIARDFDAAYQLLVGPAAWGLRERAAAAGGVIRWHRTWRRPVVAVKVAGRWTCIAPAPAGEAMGD